MDEKKKDDPQKSQKKTPLKNQKKTKAKGKKKLSYEELYKSYPKNIREKILKHKEQLIDGGFGIFALRDCTLPRLERKDQATMTTTERNNFNNIIQELINDGSYGGLVNFHAGLNVNIHAMHRFTPPFGATRFLPWHTIYHYELELLISAHDNTVKIPYWDWYKDRDFPDWVLQPDGVTRNVGGSSLPSRSNILNLYKEPDYIAFSDDLETYHGDIHMHVGGTMRNPNGSPADPVFFLHHGYVDKIWRDWQKIYPTEMLTIDGDSNILDPWEDTIEETQDITTFCTFYQGLTNWDDDVSRLFVTRSNCDRINAESDQNLVDVINNMLDGITGNADERAILKILNCLTCERLIRIINLVGRDRLFSNLHGAEDRQLSITLGKCGLIAFADWDDDVTRDFVNSISCSEINDLSNLNLKDLIDNMLDGVTGNADERAILKILNCLTCTRLATIVRLVGQNRLLSDLHGAEDTELRILLGRCGLMSFASWDDDVTRDFVNSINCDEINRLSNGSLRDLINNMLDGVTGNADERAILKILNCVSCSRLHTLVGLVGQNRLLSDLHGDEDNQLRVLLGRCGLMSFASWDDDVTRDFVNAINCTEINALSNQNLKDLIDNMLAGATGNADEQAILRILNCLTCGRLQTIVSLVGRSRLLSDLHGDEDRQLRDLYDRCGI